MNGHKAIAARLAAYSGVTAIVGTRISPDVIPAPATWPAIAYRQTYGRQEKGPTTSPGLFMGLFQVSSFAKTRLGAVTLAAQVRAALDRWRATTIAGITIDDCLFESAIDIYDPEADVYYVAADYRLFYRE